MVAFAVLFSWPLVVAILYTKLPLAHALVWSIIAGYLLLPPVVGLDPPFFPKIDKTLIPSLSAVIMGFAFFGWARSTSGRLVNNRPVRILPGWIPRTIICRIPLLMIIVGPVLTTLSNQDGLVYANTYLPGLKPYDALSSVMASLSFLLPFILARKFLAYPEEHKILLQVLCFSGLAYSLLALFEVRMSPQLNKMFYGFFQHSWVQHVRNGGFRPVVFLSHGLNLGIFFSGTVLATLATMRVVGHPNLRSFYFAAAIWLLIILVLGKTIGALAITIFFIPAVIFLNVRMQLIVAAVMALFVMSFPMLRSAGMIPVETAIVVAEGIDIQRADSLGTRFENENLLLEKSGQRPFFGWGGWSRTRIFDETGRDVTISDGLWIITLGNSGWVGYFGKFGLLSLSILFLAMRHRRFEISLVTSGLCLVLAANLLDLIPNSGLSPVTWLMAGALMGRIELARIPLSDETEPERVEVVNASRYTRGRPAEVAEPQLATTKTSEKTANRSRYTRQTKNNHRPDSAES